LLAAELLKANVLSYSTLFGFVYSALTIKNGGKKQSQLHRYIAQEDTSFRPKLQFTGKELYEHKQTFKHDVMQGSGKT
jgi:hypothetical protein